MARADCTVTIARPVEDVFAEPAGLVAVFPGLFMTMFQRRFPRDLNNLKAMMESHSL